MNYIQNNQSTNCSFNLPKATVLLIKRDPFQRLGLCKILSQQNSLTIHNCADSFTGLRLAQRYQPDVIILDLEYLVSSNFELNKQLKQQSSQSKLIVCGQQIERETVLKVYSISAGYYLEDGDISKLLLAIANTYEGSIYIHPETSHLLSSNLLLPVSSSGLDSLAPKELDALKHLITGKDYQEIGQSMCISSHTVRNYISGIVKKLGLKNRTQAVVVAVCGGLLAEAQ
ncbi:MAG: response regulator transcription factor [Waterburya sp.]